MSAQQMVNKLTEVELGMHGKIASDTQRMMRNERFALQASIESKDGRKIKAAMTEAQNVAEMWGVTL